MPLTRAQAEADVVAALGPDLLAYCGLATTTDGTNADLNGPLARALDHLGYVVADPSNVTDADLAQVPPNRVVRLLDYARIMTVDLARLRLVAGPVRQEWADYKVQYTPKDLADLRMELWTEYRRYLASGAPAVGKLAPESRNALDTARYFPPYPPLGIADIPPDV
jgi:hypothetical protein